MELLEANAGWIIDILRLNTTKHSSGFFFFFFFLGGGGGGVHDILPLTGVVYFTGAQFCDSEMVTNLFPQMPPCKPWSLPVYYRDWLSHGIVYNATIINVAY